METVAAAQSILQCIMSILWSLLYLGDPLMRQDLQFAGLEGEAVQAGDTGNTEPPSMRSLEEIVL